MPIIGKCHITMELQPVYLILAQFVSKENNESTPVLLY